MTKKTEDTIQKQNGQIDKVEVQEQEATREPERYTTPPVDIYETDNGLAVHADLPGFSKDQIDISVDNNILTIKAVAGDRGDEREATYREFAPVSYYRQFRLGEKIDRGKITAETKHGVLTLHLPYAEEQKPRRIKISAS